MVKKIFFVLSLVMFLGVFVFSVNKANATHSWGNYHWARTSNPFTLKLGDNVSSNWDAYLATTSSDWSISSILNTVTVSGANLKNCRPVKGGVEVCNKKYGNNGWLGVAQIWVDRSSHITQGSVRVNDTYFNTPTYDTPAWRNFVMCQEIGHTFGLNHQDENFSNANLGTCMDYTSDPDGKLADPDQLSNEHPNMHDFEELETIYAHLDLFARGNDKKNNNIDASDPSEWGKETRKDSKGRGSHFEREFSNGNKIFTFVIWTE